MSWLSKGIKKVAKVQKAVYSPILKVSKGKVKLGSAASKLAGSSLSKTVNSALSVGQSAVSQNLQSGFISGGSMGNWFDDLSGTLSNWSHSIEGISQSIGNLSGHSGNAGNSGSTSNPPMQSTVPVWVWIGGGLVVGFVVLKALRK